ncbi:sigma-70 family RNA polymerase sigma factor [Streptomyces chartreusis]|uniref:sigma-70 family RNA polymerase sigma factor n=1 Tax=Streptomyces chartreusis TaxID=1969 RepID=UPI0036B4C359
MTGADQLMTRLYSEHYNVLVSFVLGYVRKREQAEDIVQETLLRAWRHVERIDTHRDTVRSYLMTIARNVVTDTWRAEQRRPQVVADDEALSRVASDDDVESVLEHHLVTIALERLSTEHRTVIKMLYYQGLSIAETADTLTIPMGTVKSRAYYAVRNLRAAFEELGVLR